MTGKDPHPLVWERLPVEFLEEDFLQLGIQGYDHPVRRKYREILRTLPIESLLEVACGPGVDVLSKRAVRPEISYTGVDATAAMIEICRKRFPDETFLVADAYHLPFPDRHVDLVYAKDLFEHLKEPWRALREMVRVARKFLALAFFRWPAAKSRYRLRRWKPHGRFYSNTYSWQELMTAFAGIGFQAITLHEVAVPEDPNPRQLLVLVTLKP